MSILMSIHVDIAYAMCAFFDSTSFARSTTCTFSVYYFLLQCFKFMLIIFQHTYVYLEKALLLLKEKKRIVEGHPTKEELLSMFVRPFPTLNCIQIIFSNLECQSFMVRITNQHSLSFLCTSYMFIFDISHFCAFVS